MSDRVQVVEPSDTITSEFTTEAVDIVGFGQIAIEIDPISVVGGLTVIIELSPDGSAFYAETIEDPAGGAVASNTYTIPVYRLKRSWSGSTSIGVQVPCAGYKAVRIKVQVGTSGNANVFINKLRLAAN